jgi:DNA-binding NarL/FixJ family response regulator
MSLRILLAEDDGLVRKGLRSIIERQAGMEVVGEAADLAVVIQHARRRGLPAFRAECPAPRAMC